MSCSWEIGTAIVSVVSVILTCRWGVQRYPIMPEGPLTNYRE